MPGFFAAKRRVQGYGTTDGGRSEWGATKRTVLAFCRAGGEGALQSLGGAADLAALVAAPVAYSDRKAGAPCLACLPLLPRQIGRLTPRWGSNVPILPWQILC